MDEPQRGECYALGLTLGSVGRLHGRARVVKVHSGGGQRPNVSSDGSLGRIQTSRGKPVDCSSPLVFISV